MAEKKWTEAQLDAINREGKNILVSAAAGSGKTAVLTRRIIGKLTSPDSPADISKMLGCHLHKGCGKRAEGKNIVGAVRCHCRQSR